MPTLSPQSETRQARTTASIDDDLLSTGNEYCPSPEQIEEECRKIRANWSDRERRRRAGMQGGRQARWQPPQVRVSTSDMQDFTWAH